MVTQALIEETIQGHGQEVMFRGHFYEEPCAVAKKKNTPEQLVVLKYPNFQLEYATEVRILGYYRAD